MIIIRVTGGMGNQMFQYIFGRALQKKYNQKLAYDLTWYNISSSHRYSELQAHESFRLDVFDIHPDAIDVPQSNFFNSRVGKVFNGLHFQGIGRGMKPMFPAYYSGYWQGEAFFDNIKDEVVGIFKMPELTNDVAHNYASQIKEAPNAVSLHVRRGDSTKNPTLQICPPSYYQNAIQHIDSNLSEYNLFVFSDDVAYCREIFGDNKKITYVERAGIDLDDFHLMSLCDHHVIANSSFSWWSAWLGENKAKDGRIVMAPELWYRDLHKLAPRQRRYHHPDKILPERWVKIGF